MQTVGRMTQHPSSFRLAPLQLLLGQLSDLIDEMLRFDHHRAKRNVVGIGSRSKVHRNRKEPRSPISLYAWIDLLEDPAQGLFSIINACNDLERYRFDRSGAGHRYRCDRVEGLSAIMQFISQMEQTPSFHRPTCTDLIHQYLPLRSAKRF